MYSFLVHLNWQPYIAYYFSSNRIVLAEPGVLDAPNPKHISRSKTGLADKARKCTCRGDAEVICEYMDKGAAPGSLYELRSMGIDAVVLRIATFS